MAQLIRSAKSDTPADFFQLGADPSLDHLDPSILTSPVTDAEDPNLSEATKEYLGYLDLATRAHQKSAIDDFAAATLRLLGFRAPNTTVATRYAIPLVICGEKRAAQTDVCIIHHPTTTILLVLVADKTIFNNAAAVDVEVEAQHAETGRPTLEAMTVPCITMSGTTPTFYLIPVSKELSDAVITGQYPTSQTQVLKCITTVTHQRRVRDGMADPEFRKIALKRFLAFKDLAQSHWQQYLV
ncbi:hypothetical protein CPB84DRAFT_1776969 [Gymnopilus junonius]|uniref:Uncharacterized protein n=1 Tax=Gymnopilus junonius TaxID=109634 RepID=A0A9P5NM02_GYMJU|nr:hypothetical protein CPB84DRAFT_1776969 [Gymnopilus junonius]